MTITQYQYVLAVAKYKNFTTAAEHSFVTQPTLKYAGTETRGRTGGYYF